MSHSKEIIIKCPACEAKFEAHRETEAIFVSCPDCDMQVRISGMSERRQGRTSSKARRISSVSSIPQARHQSNLQIGDLSAGKSPIDFDSIRTRKQVREEERDLVIDESEEQGSPAPKSNTKGDSKSDLRSSIERRAAKLEERAAKLEARAAKLGQMKVSKPKAKTPPPETPKEKPKPEAPKLPEKTSGDDEKVQYDKVEVRSTGERRRLRKAPKAEVPAPRGTLDKPKYVENLRTESSEVLVSPEDVVKGKVGRGKNVEIAEKAEAEAQVEPTQDFEERRVTEGGEWRRHQPSRVESPEWEGDEPGEGQDEYNETVTEQGDIDRVPRRIFIGIISVVGLFALFASFQFILAQAGWLETNNQVVDAPPLPEDHMGRWSRAEMLERSRPVIDKLFASTSNEEALQYVRRARKVAFMMKKHYAPLGFNPIKIESLGGPQECEMVADGFFVVPVTLGDFSSRGIALQVPQFEDGDWLIDWESWVGYSEMDFSEMRLRRPKDPVVVRCYLIQDEYYNFAFADREKYLSFKLIDHTREDQLWGYIDKLSESYGKVATELAGTQGNGAADELATLKVRFLENSVNSVADQVEITDLVTFGWVLRD